MSKQSNQRYRKEREKEITKGHSSTDKVSNSIKNEPNQNSSTSNMDTPSNRSDEE